MKKKIFNIILICLVFITFLGVSPKIALAASSPTLPPADFDRVKSNIQHGTVKYIYYQSTATKSQRRAKDLSTTRVFSKQKIQCNVFIAWYWWKRG